MNMCVHGQTKEKKSSDVAYIVVRQAWNEQEGWESTIKDDPVAIHMFQEDADDMAASFNQQMKDKQITNLKFYVITTPFYD